MRELAKISKNNNPSVWKYNDSQIIEELGYYKVFTVGSLSPKDVLRALSNGFPLSNECLKNEKDLLKQYSDKLFEECLSISEFNKDKAQLLFDFLLSQDISSAYIDQEVFTSIYYCTIFSLKSDDIKNSMIENISFSSFLLHFYPIVEDYKKRKFKDIQNDTRLDKEAKDKEQQLLEFSLVKFIEFNKALADRNFTSFSDLIIQSAFDDSKSGKEAETKLITMLNLAFDEIPNTRIRLDTILASRAKYMDSNEDNITNISLLEKRLVSSKYLRTDELRYFLKKLVAHKDFRNTFHSEQLPDYLYKQISVIANICIETGTLGQIPDLLTPQDIESILYGKCIRDSGIIKDFMTGMLDPDLSDSRKLAITNYINNSVETLAITVYQENFTNIINVYQDSEYYEQLSELKKDLKVSSSELLMHILSQTDLKGLQFNDGGPLNLVPELLSELVPTEIGEISRKDIRKALEGIDVNGLSFTIDRQSANDFNQAIMKSVNNKYDGLTFRNISKEQFSLFRFEDCLEILMERLFYVCHTMIPEVYQLKWENEEDRPALVQLIYITFNGLDLEFPEAINLKSFFLTFLIVEKNYMTILQCREGHWIY